MPINHKDQKQDHFRHTLESKSATGKRDAWQFMVQLANQICLSQLDAFSGRLSHALFALSESANDAKEANLCFHGAQLLKNGAAGYKHLSVLAIESIFKSEISILAAVEKPKTTISDAAMSLVSYEEMELKLSFNRASRSLELANAEPLAALNMRFASLLDVESISVAQNPFRPEVFLRALNTAWCEFNTEKAAHSLVLALIADHLFDLAPIYHALNEFLVSRGILPDLQETFRLKRKQASIEAARVGEVVKNEVAKKLEQYFSEQAQPSNAPGASESMTGSSMGYAPAFQSQNSAGMNAQYPHESMAFNPASSELFQYLADVQKNMAIHQLVAGAQNTMRLSHLRQNMPTKMHAGVETHTFDLLSQVFDGVFGNHDIPEAIKSLIGLLQVPVLKAALIDKDFFFQDTHPARRLIELLTKYSVSLDAQKGEDDPLFQAMQRNVLRVQQEFDQELGLFDEVVLDLEQFIQKEEAASLEAIEAPIKRALQKEKFKQASIAANGDVALRIGSGEVLGFVETFLESRWTKVLTLAYSVKDEKPHAVVDAIKTMDDLIWSIQPKITLAQRQEMINRLPGILARLNKWLSLIKWEDADRIQFFADLAECHASIVRAPLELSPERQVEIAVEAAKLATERRLEKRAKVEAEQAEKNQAEEREKAQLIARAVGKATAAALQEKTHQQGVKAVGDASPVDPINKVANSQTQINATPSGNAVSINDEADANRLSSSGLPELIEPSSLAPASELTITSSVEATGTISITEKVEQELEEAVATVADLERGVWVQFTNNDRTTQKVRLAWISPMRSLFIFTSSQKEKSFSVSADELEKSLFDKRVQIISVDKLVDKALLEALNKPKTMSKEGPVTQ